MIWLHQEEVDLLKTVILSPHLPLPPSPLHLKRPSTLSKLTSSIVSPAGMFRRLSAHLGAELSVCRLAGGQQKWVLSEGAVDAGIPNRW